MPDESALSLVERLRAALDRAEEIARAAAAPSLHWREDSAWLTDMLDPLPSQRAERAPGWQPMITPEEIKHIAANDPAHVLRTVAAHRKILDRHAPVELERTVCEVCSSRTWDDEELIGTYPCVDVLALASIYFPEGTEP